MLLIASRQPECDMKQKEGYVFSKQYQAQESGKVELDTKNEFHL